MGFCDDVCACGADLVGFNRGAGACIYPLGGFADPGETTVSEYEALAKNVIRRTLHIQPKENVIVETWNHGLPIATEVVYQVRAAGARPMLLFEDEDTYWKSVTTLPESKLGQVGSHEWKAMSEADGYV